MRTRDFTVGGMPFQERIPEAGDLLWRWHIEGDSRIPIPELGDRRTLPISTTNVLPGDGFCNGRDLGDWAAEVVGYGTLDTRGASNYVEHL